MQVFNAAVFAVIDRDGVVVESYDVFIIFRVDDRLTKRFGWFLADNVVNTLYVIDLRSLWQSQITPTVLSPYGESVSRSPSGVQAWNGISQSVLEGRNNDAASRAGHTLHIAQNKRSSYAVRFAGASPCDDNGSVRTDKLRQALELVKVNFFSPILF